MSNIINFLSPYMPMVVAVLIVILLYVVALIATKKLGLTLIQTTKAIVDLIRKGLTDAKIGNEQLSNILMLMSQAIVYVIAISESDDIDAQTNEGLRFVRDIIREFGYTVTDAELVIIADVLKMAFQVISSMNLKVTALKVNKDRVDVASVTMIAAKLQMNEYKSK